MRARAHTHTHTHTKSLKWAFLVFCGAESANKPTVPRSRGRSLTRSGPGGSSWRSSAGTTRSGWTWWRRGRPRTWATATCTPTTTSTPTSRTLTSWIDPISFTVLVSWFSGPGLLWFVLIQKFFALSFFLFLYFLLWGGGGGHLFV